MRKLEPYAIIILFGLVLIFIGIIMPPFNHNPVKVWLPTNPVLKSPPSEFNIAEVSVEELRATAEAEPDREVYIECDFDRGIRSALVIYSFPLRSVGLKKPILIQAKQAIPGSRQWFSSYSPVFDTRSGNVNYDYPERSLSFFWIGVILIFIGYVVRGKPTRHSS